MDAELLELLPDVISIKAPDGTYTDRGKENFGFAKEYPARIEPAQGEVIVYGPGGEERQAKWKIYVGTTDAIDPEGELTLPIGFDPRVPPFFAVARETDQNGAHHNVITV
tara:strand:- start:25162 stop:25491 length:330 start_codon:yes stop_codon:yes gene_type:complete